MAAGESATVFLETSLGTRLVVSFPASATTVANLKRQVSAEHAACFPRAGPIAVTSLQAKYNGSWFHLTDSMAVEAAFRWINGPWHLLVEAHELPSHPLAHKDENCRSGDSEQNVRHPVTENSSQNMSLHELSQGGVNLAIGDGDSDTPQMKHQDKPHEGVEHASGQREGGNAMPQEISYLHFAGGGNDTPLTNQQDKSQEGVNHALGQCEDGDIKTMLQESSHSDVAADKDNGPVGGLQKVDIAEPRGKKHFREEDKNDESIVANRDSCLSSLASSTFNVELSELKSSGTEQANLNTDTLPDNLGDRSHGLGKISSFGQKEPWTSGVLNGESSNNITDIPPCVDSLDRDNPSDKEVKAHRDGGEEPQVAGLCAGESHSKGTNIPHCIESMDRAHKLHSHPLARKDAKCGTCDMEQNVGHQVAEDSTQNTSLPVASQGGGNLALGNGDRDTSQINQQDKPYEFSGQHEHGNTMPRESSDLDLAPGDTPPTNQQDKSHEGVEDTSGQCKDGNRMPQESSDLDVTADKENGPVGGQHNDIIVETRGKKRFREEDTNDESIIVNCDGSLSSLASPTLNKLSEQKSSETVQENVNTDPLISNLGDCSHSLGEKPSCGLKEPWTSSVCNGESSNSGSDIPPCVEFIEGDNSSDKEIKAHRGEKEEPHIARLCTGESSCKGTDVPHCVESTKEDSMRPNSNNHYLNKGKYEWATSTVSTEPEECFRRRERRVAVRKVAVS